MTDTLYHLEPDELAVLARYRRGKTPDRGLRESLERLLDEIERDCSPLAEDPENGIDYNEGICYERGRIAGILDSLLSPEAAHE
jgi:hypothetical protein